MTSCRDSLPRRHRSPAVALAACTRCFPRSGSGGCGGGSWSGCGPARVRHPRRADRPLVPARRPAPRPPGPPVDAAAPPRLSRTTAYAIRLGRAQYFRRVFARAEDQTLILPLPRSGKSGMLGDRVIDHPGAALVTESRPDIYTPPPGTAPARPHRGVQPRTSLRHPVHFPVGHDDGCEDPAEAIRRAADLVGAVANPGRCPGGGKSPRRRSPRGCTRRT